MSCLDIVHTDTVLVCFRVICFHARQNNFMANIQYNFVLFYCTQYHLYLYFQDCYSMTRRARAIIVNMEHNREGSEVDANKLSKLFKDLDFDVITDGWKNLTYEVNRKPMYIVIFIHTNIFLSPRMCVRFSVWLSITIYLCL